MAPPPRRTAPLALVAALLAAAAAAQPPPAGEEFQVNTTVAGHQEDGAVAAGESGDFVVVWDSYLQDGSGDGVFAQRFDAAGRPLGTEFQVSTTTTDTQYRAAVAADAAGDFVVVWESYGQDGDSWGIFGQRFDAAGNPLGEEFQVNTQTTGVQTGAAVAADAAGNFVVVWASTPQDGSEYGVFGQRFDEAGNPLGVEFQVNTYTTDFQLGPEVAADSDGDFVVVWESFFDQDGSADGVFGQRFDAAGNRVGGEFQVNTYTTSVQAGPAVAVDGAGRFVVVWNSFPQDGAGFGVFGQRFDAAGNPSGSEFRVNTETADDQLLPAVETDAAGGFVAVWQRDAQHGSGRGVFGQAFDAAGDPRGGEFPVNTETAGSQSEAAVAGNLVVVWTSSGQDGDGNGIFGQRFAGVIFADGFESGDTSAWSQTVP